MSKKPNVVIWTWWNRLTEVEQEEILETVYQMQEHGNWIGTEEDNE